VRGKWLQGPVQPGFFECLFRVVCLFHQAFNRISEEFDHTLDIGQNHRDKTNPARGMGLGQREGLVVARATETFDLPEEANR
jgi:hypothetical protein